MHLYDYLLFIQFDKYANGVLEYSGFLSVVSLPNIYLVELIRPGRSPGKAGNTTRR